MNAYLSLAVGLGLLGIAAAAVVVFAGLLRGRLENPEVANDTRRFDAFSEGDREHTVVHVDDVGHERY